MIEKRDLEMSVIIVTPDDYDTIRRTIRSLRNQSSRDRMEIVIVAPSAEMLHLEEAELKDVRQVRVVEVGEVQSIAWASAAGIRQASASMVALAEDHVFLDPGWAAALIAAHRRPWAAVGPVVRNANPGSRVSWADLLTAYGPWLDPTPAGVVDHLPGHNSSYKRAILLGYGPQLEAMLESESVLHWDLRAKGYDLYLEPAAKIYHQNFELLTSWLPAQFHSGRLFASARARPWSPLRRLLYTAGAPLIPVVRFWRVLPLARRSGHQRNLPSGVFPTLLLGLIVRTAGEALGYALGAGQARRKLSRFEFHRVRHLRSK